MMRRMSRYIFSVAFFTLVLGTAAGQETPDYWKKLDKMRITSGIAISRVRELSSESNIMMAPIRGVLEKAGVSEAVSIILIFDFGQKIDLGTYTPVIKQNVPEGGGDPVKTVLFETIPNAFLMHEPIRFNVGDFYTLQFLNAEGKLKASLRVRLKLS